MSKTLAAVLGGAAGAVALVILVIVIIWFYLCNNRSVSRTSDTGSSDPSIQVGRTAGFELTLREARRFEMEELSLATKRFSDKSLIGEGKFGEVYKRLLHDGMLVAIKKRPGPPSQEYVEEVRYLTSIQHRNIVTLLGYCQENGQQILVYEYIPNESVSIHLYGSGQVTKEKLEFKHRLSIALGAAKGDPLQNQWSLLEKYSCKASKLHLKLRRFKIFLDTLEHQLLMDRRKNIRKRHAQVENCPTTASATVCGQGKALGNDNRADKVVLLDGQNIQKSGSGKGSSLKRNANIGINRSNCKGDFVPLKTATQRRKPGTATNAAAYKR